MKRYNVDGTRRNNNKPIPFCLINYYPNNIKQNSYKFFSGTGYLDDYLNSFFIYYTFMYNCLET